jgi:hypothetical protein
VTDSQTFSKSLNAALAPVSFRGTLLSTQDAEGPGFAGQNALGLHPGTPVVVRVVIVPSTGNNPPPH